MINKKEKKYMIEQKKNYSTRIQNYWKLIYN